MVKPNPVCEHGRLRRSCHDCERIEEIAALRARVAELEARPVAWCSEDCHLNGCEAARASYFAALGGSVNGSGKRCRASASAGTGET